MSRLSKSYNKYSIFLKKKLKLKRKINKPNNNDEILMKYSEVLQMEVYNSKKIEENEYIDPTLFNELSSHEDNVDRQITFIDEISITSDLDDTSDFFKNTDNTNDFTFVNTDITSENFEINQLFNEKKDKDTMITSDQFSTCFSKDKHPSLSEKNMQVNLLIGKDDSYNSGKSFDVKKDLQEYVLLNEPEKPCTKLPSQNEKGVSTESNLDNYDITNACNITNTNPGLLEKITSDGKKNCLVELENNSDSKESFFTCESMVPVSSATTNTSVPASEQINTHTMGCISEKNTEKKPTQVSNILSDTIISDTQLVDNFEKKDELLITPPTLSNRSFRIIKNDNYKDSSNNSVYITEDNKNDFFSSTDSIPSLNSAKCKGRTGFKHFYFNKFMDYHSDDEKKYTKEYYHTKDMLYSPTASENNLTKTIVQRNEEIIFISPDYSHRTLEPGLTAGSLEKQKRTLKRKNGSKNSELQYNEQMTLAKLRIFHDWQIRTELEKYEKMNSLKKSNIFVRREYEGNNDDSNANADLKPWEYNLLDSDYIPVHKNVKRTKTKSVRFHPNVALKEIPPNDEKKTINNKETQIKTITTCYSKILNLFKFTSAYDDSDNVPLPHNSCVTRNMNVNKNKNSCASPTSTLSENIRLKHFYFTPSEDPRLYATARTFDDKLSDDYQMAHQTVTTEQFSVNLLKIKRGTKDEANILIYDFTSPH
ncbi:uncharacterized protein SCDLUD_001210 [Saccharomycodes ludwigii]|uniref:uncharacterized protein n=1 Tax=Saccharomycodes ludwigii TaxID=36035 RepID=UPI001E88E603|nr:hypothetical protein SCDLUD_001210 [Saccharomycodes ludwigii]KAH3903568.1 hypothetical protein SCDLUD_001210 [Saccharomycodes ludwigii]